MAENAEDRRQEGRGGFRSVRVRLLIALTGAIVLILGAFFLWDYATGWKAQLRDKEEALASEALAILSAVQIEKGSPDRVQEYIDRLCRPRSEQGAAHRYVAVRLAGRSYASCSSAEMEARFRAALRETAAQPVGGESKHTTEAIIAAAREGENSVWVAESTETLRSRWHAALLRRLLSMICLGAVLTITLTFLTHRLAMKPMTALAEAVRRVGAGELGTQVTSPMPSELRALADRFNRMSSSLADVERERTREMNKARRIQSSLLPSEADLAELGVFSTYRPATEVAGDFFDVLRGDDEALILAVADVSGHGVPAAMGAAMLKTLFSCAASESSNPAAIIERINRGFAPVTLDEDFATMIVVALDRKSGLLQYASAGHEPAYLLRGSGGVETLGSTGPVLGFQEAGEWESARIESHSGDRLVIVTDGLAEARNVAGELFGKERLFAALREATGAGEVDSFPAAVIS